MTSYEKVKIETNVGYYPFIFHPAVRIVSKVNSIHSSKILYLLTQFIKLHISANYLSSGSK